MNKTEKNQFEITAEITQIGNRAVRKAQEENRRLGISNVYSKRGYLYYQLPNGEITTEKQNIEQSD